MKTLIEHDSNVKQTFPIYDVSFDKTKWIMKTAPFTLVLSFWILMFAGLTYAKADENRSLFHLPYVKYRGGNYKPRPEAIGSLLGQVAKRTSVEVQRSFLPLDLTDPKLFRYPMIYMAGNARFYPFNQKELRLLRNYLNLGGFLLIDDGSGVPNSDFDNSVRKTISNLFPNTPLKEISRDHSIFRSFYLISQVTGRVSIKPYLEGVDIKGRTALVYSVNDLGGAWSTNKLGHWNYDVVGGGAMQRKISARLGVNIVLYALTLDYKKDMVHLPIILERLRRYDLR